MTGGKKTLLAQVHSTSETEPLKASDSALHCGASDQHCVLIVSIAVYQMQWPMIHLKNNEPIGKRIVSCSLSLHTVTSC